MSGSYPTTDASKRRWQPARPTIHAGVLMRSRREAGMARWLDEQGIEWQYEPYALSGPEGQYLPDFVLPRCPRSVEGVNGSRHRFTFPTTIEVKPTGWWDEGDLQRMVDLTNAAGMELMLATPMGFAEVSATGATVYVICLAYRQGEGFHLAEGPWRADWWRS